MQKDMTIPVSDSGLHYILDKETCFTAQIFFNFPQVFILGLETEM